MAEGDPTTTTRTSRPARLGSFPTFRAGARRAASWLVEAAASPGRHPVFLLVLFAIACAPRASFALVDHQPTFFLVSDMQIYRLRAIRILDGPLGREDAFTPPGFPAAVALLFAVFGRDDAVVGVFHVALGAATAVFTYLIALRVSRRVEVAAAAFAATAFAAPLIFYTGFFLTETLCAFLLAGFVLLFARAIDRPSTWLAGLAGLAIALAAITRPNVILFLPLLGAFALSSGPSVRRTARAALLAAIPVLLLACVRTSVLTGRPAGLATNGGVNFYLAHADVSAIRFSRGFIRQIAAHQSRARVAAIEESDHEVDDEAWFYEKTLALFADQPARLATSLGNVVDGVGLGPIRGRENPAYWPGYMGRDDELTIWLRAIFALAILPAAIAGAIVRDRGDPRERAPRQVLLALFVAVVATLALFLGDPRVMVAVLPLVFVLAADAWWRLATRLARR